MYIYLFTNFRLNLTQMAAKIDSLKKWTVSTYKTTKQSICENLGRVRKFLKFLFNKISSVFARTFAECSSNCDSLRSVAHNGELLERALSFFLSSIKTLSEKTFEDTIETIHNYDQVVLINSNQISAKIPVFFDAFRQKAPFEFKLPLWF
uniref:Bm4348, isoform c n=1 Tax=Brugia malayi TaxID=6279 RepID=A0A1I9G420_BRUMA|nr:Bm4348, isoform c [Brugia malayi]